MAAQLPALLTEKYNAVIIHATQQAAWYKSKKWKKIGSKAIRLSSIVLIGMGGLFPIIKEIRGVEVGNWGYITIGIAGTLLFIDRFFGLSSGWIRYTLTQMEIYRQIREFEQRWLIMILKATQNPALPPQDPPPPGQPTTPTPPPPPTPPAVPAGISSDKVIELITMIKDFSNQIDEIVKQETNTWATEFQTNLADLQKIADKNLEELRPVSLQLVVKNADNYTTLSLHIDGVFRKEVTKGESLIDNLSKGPHAITITGEKAGTTLSTTKVVNLEAGKMGSVEITMP
ncbi:MAG TPA: SLATT domain-containing protein [Puia sp.]|jgi:hypothetical protein|nr:SLATT domain-containing protein [Puia sp.]